MRHYDFVQNKECEYFPCHQGVNPESFNCLFCYCPLFALGDKCGGSFVYTDGGIKDCSNCLKPHYKENFDKIMKKMPLLIEMAKKKT